MAVLLSASAQPHETGDGRCQALPADDPAEWHVLPVSLPGWLAALLGRVQAILPDAVITGRRRLPLRCTISAATRCPNPRRTFLQERWRSAPRCRQSA